MVTSLNRGTPARELGYETIQYICVRHTLTGTDLPVTKIGTIPIGSVVVAIATRVVTAVTGGTPVLGIGAVAAGGAVPTVGTGANVNAVIAEAAGSEWLVPTATFAGPLAADTDYYIGTSGSATAGDVVAAVFFIKPLA